MRRRVAGRAVERDGRVEALSPLEVVAALDDEALLVDVRDERERVEQGVIRGAVSAPGDTLVTLADPASARHGARFDLDRRIVVYCAVGDGSAVAAGALHEMGFDRVAYLLGGLAAWKAAGLEVDPPSPARPTTE